MFLAEAAAAAADHQLSGEWVLALIGKIFAGAGVLVGAVLGTHKYATKKERDRHRTVTLAPPVPTISAHVSPPPHPSWDQHTALEGRVVRIEQAIESDRKEQARQYLTLLETGQQRELRLIDKMDDLIKGVYERLNDLAKEIRNKGPR